MLGPKGGARPVLPRVAGQVRQGRGPDRRVQALLGALPSLHRREAEAPRAVALARPVEEARLGRPRHHPKEERLTTKSVRTHLSINKVYFSYYVTCTLTREGREKRREKKRRKQIE